MEDRVVGTIEPTEPMMNIPRLKKRGDSLYCIRPGADNGVGVELNAILVNYGNCARTCSQVPVEVKSLYF